MGVFATPAALAGDRDPRCGVAAAAAHHRVNSHLLQAVLDVESRGNPRTVTVNKNGTIDVGLGGTNSIHFKGLAPHGIVPEHLLDACVSRYVTAWMLAKAIDDYPEDRWFGIGAYHSRTPRYNQRYQVLVYNELVRAGAMTGSALPVPSLRDLAAPITESAKEKK